jgi:WD40 repeat protein
MIYGLLVAIQPIIHPSLSNPAHCIPSDAPIHSFAVSPDGTCIALGVRGAVRILDVETGAHVSTLPFVDGKSVDHVLFGDGIFVAVAGYDAAAVSVYRRTRDDTIFLKAWTARTHVHCLAFDREREIVAAGTVAGKVLFWSPTGTPLGELSAHSTPTISEHLRGRPTLASADVIAIGYSPQAALFATAGGDGRVKVWDADTRTLVRDLSFPWATTLAWYDENTLIVASGMSGALAVFFLDGRPVLGPLRPHRQFVTATAASATAGCFVTGGDDGKIRVWSMDQGALVREDTLEPHSIRATAFTSDGSRFVVVRGRELCFWPTARLVPANPE